MLSAWWPWTSHWSSGSGMPLYYNCICKSSSTLKDSNIFANLVLLSQTKWKYNTQLPDSLNWKPAGAICWNADNSSGKELFLRRLRIVRCVGNEDVYLKVFEDKQLVPNSTNFYVISAYSFDVILMVEKSTWFPCTFLDVISMVEKSILFPRTFIGVILMVKICTLFLLTFFNVILMGTDWTSFLVSCKLMKTFEKIFTVFVTLNSWLLQDCSL